MMDIATTELFHRIALIEQKIEAVNQKTSYLFNWLDFFWVDENCMSDILAFLLDPREKHGQGNLYLETFLNIFELQVDRIESVAVYREKGRIDILVEIGDIALVIENKYRGAADQCGQIDRYVAMCLEHGKKPENLYVFYLSKGEEPSEYSLTKEFRLHLKEAARLKCVPFGTIKGYSGRSMADFIREAFVRTQSIKMRFFLEDLLNHIEGDRTLDQFESEFFTFLDADGSRVEQAKKLHELYGKYKNARESLNKPQ